MTQKIAFLGLGAMGARMAGNLIKTGFEVTVWNRTAARADSLLQIGAAWAGTPAEAAKDADFVISMVRDDQASRDVWLASETGALGAIRDGATAIECSTLTVDHVHMLAAKAEVQGVPFLDAPLAGSRPQADAAQLIFLVGGDVAVLDTARPALEAMGSAVHHAGATGAGTAVKLAVNALLGIQAAAMAELIGMLQKTGTDPATALEILGATPVISPIAKGVASMMLAGAFQPMFPVDLMEKDFGYIQAAGDDMPMTAATRAVLQHAIEEGFGADNFTGLVRLYREADRATYAA